MKPKAVCRTVVDLAMTVLLLFQMGYHLWGERTHEWTGAVLFLLFLLHQLLNRSWYKSLFWGKYTPVRVLWLVVDLLVLAAMAAQLYSGIILSRYVFRFLPIHRGMALARRLHILGAYWGYLFIGLHLGLHWGAVLKGLEKRFPAGQSSFPPAAAPPGGPCRRSLWGLCPLETEPCRKSLFEKRVCIPGL